MKSTKDLLEKRRLAFKAAREIQDLAEKEKREMTPEEDQRWEKAYTEVTDLKGQIEKIDKRNDLERQEAEVKLKNEADERATQSGAETTFQNPRASKEYDTVFRAFLTRDHKTLTADEHRALSAGTATEGGFLFPSEQFNAELIANVVDATIFRGLARSFAINGNDSLGTPTLPNRMSDAEWTSELGIPSTDTTLSFGKRSLTPHPLAKEIRVSKTLLRKAPGSDSIVREELARVKGEAEENAFMTGDGSQKPLGIFTSSSDGISTSRDISTGNTTSSPTFDGLKAAKYELKEVYWPASSWIFHRDIMELIAKLKDGNGRYLLQDSVVEGEPDRMLNFPTHMSEFAPSTATTGLLVGILGDYNNYWIVDSLAMTIQVAQELLIRENQDLFVLRSETDGAPVREEAFVRVKLA